MVKVEWLYNHLRNFYNPNTHDVRSGLRALAGVVNPASNLKVKKMLNDGFCGSDHSTNFTCHPAYDKYYLYMGLLNINTEIETTGKWSDQLYKDYVIEKFEKSQDDDDNEDENENKPSELEKDIEVNFYPPYMNGCAGHIISKNIAEYIVENINSPKTQEYTNEDASLGIWLYNAPFVRHINYDSGPGFLVRHRPSGAL